MQTKNLNSLELVVKKDEYLFADDVSSQFSKGSMSYRRFQQRNLRNPTITNNKSTVGENMSPGRCSACPRPGPTARTSGWTCSPPGWSAASGRPASAHRQRRRERKQTNKQTRYRRLPQQQQLQDPRVHPQIPLHLWAWSSNEQLHLVGIQLRVSLFRREIRAAGGATAVSHREPEKKFFREQSRTYVNLGDGTTPHAHDGRSASDPKRHFPSFRSTFGSSGLMNSSSE